jgi:hypothetical protein
MQRPTSKRKRTTEKAARKSARKKRGTGDGSKMLVKYKFFLSHAYVTTKAAISLGIAGHLKEKQKRS